MDTNSEDESLANIKQLSEHRKNNFELHFIHGYRRTRNKMLGGENPKNKVFYRNLFQTALKTTLLFLSKCQNNIKPINKIKKFPQLASNFLKGNFARFTFIFLIIFVVCYSIFFVVKLNQYDSEHWANRLDERVLSPIYGRDDILVGAIQSKNTQLNFKSAYDLGFIPLPNKTPIPPIYRAALLEREDRGLREGGAHHIFGIDFPRLLWAWLNFRGGSSLTMQIVKNLEGWGNEKSVIGKILRKLEELPAAIQLYRHLANQGGDTQSKIIRLYAGIHKIWTPDTGIRGIEAGARVTFDTTPDKLTAAQQLLLSAVTGVPLAPPSEDAANKVHCQTIWPKKNNDKFDQNVEAEIAASASDFEIRQFKIRKSQCRTIWRAKHTAIKLSESGVVFKTDEALRRVLDELEDYELKGIYPVNPFTGLSDRESVSISKRTKEIITPHLLNLLSSESRGFSSGAIGSPLQINLLSGEQSEFILKLNKALEKFENDSGNTLCIPIVNNGKSLSWQNHCDGLGTGTRAIIYAGAVDISSGLLLHSFSNYEDIFDAKFNIGSLAKLPVLVAAVKAGYTAEAEFCPKSAVRNGKKLRRVTDPKFGFSDCSNNLVTLLDATARSDNLAFFDLAKLLGPDRLNATLKELGMQQVSDPAYELSFGQYETTIMQTIKMSQIIVAKANDISLHGIAPTLLIGKGKHLTPKTLILTEQQSLELKKLLAAPVSSKNGTLRRLAGFGIMGGKTGTSNSPSLTDQGDNFIAGKWSVFYDARSDSLGLLAIVSPRPSVPLMSPNVRGMSFTEVEKLVIGK